MTTIPRVEIDAIGKRYGVIGYGLDSDPNPEWARRTAANYRHAVADVDPLHLLEEAEELDALADRYEREDA